MKRGSLKEPGAVKNPERARNHNAGTVWEISVHL